MGEPLISPLAHIDTKGSILGQITSKLRERLWIMITSNFPLWTFGDDHLEPLGPLNLAHV